jgi:hypothetical protein
MPGAMDERGEERMKMVDSISPNLFAATRPWQVLNPSWDSSKDPTDLIHT